MLLARVLADVSQKGRLTRSGLTRKKHRLVRILQQGKRILKLGIVGINNSIGRVVHGRVTLLICDKQMYDYFVD
jgi:hypothetical protein